jgi:hypothetical protein
MELGVFIPILKVEIYHKWYWRVCGKKRRCIVNLKVSISKLFSYLQPSKEFPKITLMRLSILYIAQFRTKKIRYLKNKLNDFEINTAQFISGLYLIVVNGFLKINNWVMRKLILLFSILFIVSHVIKKRI